jgi:hypothetical protein
VLDSATGVINNNFSYSSAFRVKGKQEARLLRANGQFLLELLNGVEVTSNQEQVMSGLFPRESNQGLRNAIGCSHDDVISSINHLCKAFQGSLSVLR